MSLMRPFGQRTCAVDMALLFRTPLFLPGGIQGRSLGRGLQLMARSQAT